MPFSRVILQTLLLLILNAIVFSGTFLLADATRASTITSTIELTKNDNKVSLVPYTSYFCSRDAIPSPEEATKHFFEPIKSPQINFGVVFGECWFRLTLRNSEITQEKYFVQVLFSLLDYVDLYTLEDTHYKLTKMGDQYPFSSRELRIPIHTAGIVFDAQETKTIYIRAKTYNTLVLPLVVSGYQPFIEEGQYDQWISGLFYGFLMGLIVFGLYIAIYFKELAYLHYSVHIVVIVFIFLALDGYSMRFWPEAVNWQDMSLSLFVYAAVITAISFGNYYLHIKNHSRLQIISLWIFRIAWAGIFSLFFLPNMVSVILSSIVATSGITVLLVMSVTQLINGHDSARYYTVGWGSFLFMALMLVFSSFGFIHVNVDPTIFVKTGFIFMQFLIAIGIGKRIQLLQVEKQQGDTHAIRAEAENRAKSDFLAKMSHEIRTPMNAVLGILQVLRGSHMDDDTKALLRTAHHSGNALMEIINDILDYSKIEAGMLKLEKIPFDLKQLISECGQLFSIPAEKKGVELVWKISSDVPQYIKSDPTRLRQIINNLLSNSLKFTAKGKIEISVKRQVSTANENQILLCFAIKDSGIGISSENLGKLFQSFQQADDSTTRKYGGTGLGLTICKQLTELLGGEITVESIVGLGTVFHFSISACEAKKSDIIEEGDLERFDLPNLSRLRVLIAEDNPVNMLVITRLLQKTGIAMVVAEDGQKAVSLYTDQPVPFDLILMDCEMPNMDGFSASKAIRELEAANGTRQIPIIALTAHATEDIKERCIEFGMDDYLPKPIDMKQLNAILNRWAN